MKRFHWLQGLALASLAERAWACPGCKEALFDPGQLPQKLATAKGYALSIGLLLAVPAAVLGFIAVQIVRAIRRHQRAARPESGIDTLKLSG